MNLVGTRGVKSKKIQQFLKASVKTYNKLRKNCDLYAKLVFKNIDFAFYYNSKNNNDDAWHFHRMFILAISEHHTIFEIL